MHVHTLHAADCVISRNLSTEASEICRRLNAPFAGLLLFTALSFQRDPDRSDQQTTEFSGHPAV
jgi:hypothetical protein